MKAKRGVRISDLEYVMRVALIAAEEVYIKVTGKQVTITSTGEGVHSAASYHPYGCAFDTRIWFINRADQIRITNRIQFKLGRDFDVVLKKTHIHIEYDLKRAEDGK